MTSVLQCGQWGAQNLVHHPHSRDGSVVTRVWVTFSLGTYLEPISLSFVSSWGPMTLLSTESEWKQGLPSWAEVIQCNVLSSFFLFST
jgi:hypothetical protein